MFRLRSHLTPWRRHAILFRPCIVLLGLLLTGSSAAAQHPVSSEQALKAAFIYNFTKFITWPSTPSPPSPFRICVSDDAGMVTALNDTIRGKQVAGQSIAIVSLRDTKELPACQILFLTHLPPDERSRLLAAARGKPILTVGEEKGFATRGGIINFFTSNDRVQFEINVDNARRAGFEISSRLLSLARIVKEIQP